MASGFSGRIEAFLLSPLSESRAFSGLSRRKMDEIVDLLGGRRVIDLLLYTPQSIADRRPTTFHGRVVGHKRRLTKRGPHTVHMQLIGSYHSRNKEASALRIAFFHWPFQRLRERLPVGQARVVSGRVKKGTNGTFLMVNPDFVVDPLQGGPVPLPLFEAVYGLKGGLKNAFFRERLAWIFSQWDSLDGGQGGEPSLEWWPDSFVQKNGWPSFKEALRGLHFPQNAGVLDKKNPIMMRLSADEWLANLHAARCVRQKRGIAFSSLRESGRTRECPDLWRTRLAEAGIVPTKSQLNAISDMTSDLESGRAMLRLLQGDVGSGKTLVAEWLLIQAVSVGLQGALMAPTDILAHQHYRTLKTFYPSVDVGILSQSISAREKRKILDSLRSGALSVVVGTHALVQENVKFSRLGACVIDEQHRFGVQQRLALVEKGFGGGSRPAPHTLLMSATPIPRTLSLALYGDIQVSMLLEKPENRACVKTLLLPMDQIAPLAEKLRTHLEQADRRAYWVCPLIEESHASDLSSIDSRLKFLYPIFKERLGVLHGRLSAQEKAEVIDRFARGDIRLLLSTSVIEVGVHVAEACAIVIENSQNFGLAQLHQLRGRVGRSVQDSYCILLFRGPLSPLAKERLRTIRGCSDGFHLARKDLSLRGEGERLGLRQAGHSEGLFLDIRDDFQREWIQDLAHSTDVDTERTVLLRRLFCRTSSVV